MTFLNYREMWQALWAPRNVQKSWVWIESETSLGVSGKSSSCQFAIVFRPPDQLLPFCFLLLNYAF